MAQANSDNSRTDFTAQFKTRGYMLSEDDEMILKDLFASMDATAFAYDMDQGGTANFELTGDQVAAVMRTWARVGKQVLSGIPFVNEALARKRDDQGHRHAIIPSFSRLT